MTLQASSRGQVVASIGLGQPGSYGWSPHSTKDRDRSSLMPRRDEVRCLDEPIAGIWSSFVSTVATKCSEAYDESIDPVVRTPTSLANIGSTTSSREAPVSAPPKYGEDCVLARSLRLHVNVTVVGVANEPMSATLQLFIEFIQKDVRQERRKHADNNLANRPRSRGLNQKGAG